jgi:hypothetical protein
VAPVSNVGIAANSLSRFDGPKSHPQHTPAACVETPPTSLLLILGTISVAGYCSPARQRRRSWRVTNQSRGWCVFVSATIFVIAGAFIYFLRSRRNREIAEGALAGAARPRLNKGEDSALPDLLGVALFAFIAMGILTLVPGISRRKSVPTNHLLSSNSNHAKETDGERAKKSSHTRTRQAGQADDAGPSDKRAKRRRSEKELIPEPIAAGAGACR